VRYRFDGSLEFLGRLDHQVKVRGFRIDLGEIEAVLARHPGVRDAAAVVVEENGKQRLAAYVTHRKAPGPSSRELRRYVREKLPEHMVPAVFVSVPEMPTGPNGKVNKGALPSLPALPDGEHQRQTPRTRTEKLLADIWESVLGVRDIGIDDNFFELGGDSILSIQVMARANEAGLSLTTRQMFENQTIAQLAEVAGCHAVEPEPERPLPAAVPLTPIQHWFFELDLPEPQHFNQAIVLSVPRRLEHNRLERAFSNVLQRHDCFRLRYTQRGGEWEQSFADEIEPAAIDHIDLSTVLGDQRRALVEQTSARLQQTLSLHAGPLIRAAYFDAGPADPGRLTIVVHHLIVDGVSWRILIDELATAYNQIDREPGRPATPFYLWAERLQAYSHSEEVRAEAAYWLDAKRTRAQRLLDRRGAGPNTVASARTVVVSLSTADTDVLLHEAQPAFRASAGDILAASLVHALAEHTGARSFLLDIEGHGREPLFKDLDMSRTIGWFTSVYPFFIELNDIEDPIEVLKQVKEQLRAVPNNGIRYGLLRYGAGDAEIRTRLRDMPQPDISFNYFGQLSRAENDYAEEAVESPGPVQDARGRRAHPIEINSSVRLGRFEAVWTYSANLHTQAEVEGLAAAFLAALRTLLSGCRSASAFTPSDFAHARVSQHELDKLLSRIAPRSGP
jgi:non-ribosomal peptide synthase protein (TIGR01720 family)